MNQKRRDIEIFAGFLPAIEICQIDWNDCSYYPNDNEENNDYDQRPWPEYIRSFDEILTDGYTKLINPTTLHFNTQQNTIPQTISTVHEENNSNPSEDKSQDVDSGEESAEGGVHPDQRSSSNSSDDCRIYFSDQRPQSSTKNRPIPTATIVEPYILKTLKSITDPLQVKRLEELFSFKIFLFFQIEFVRCEALRIHGYHDEVFKLAQQLADRMLVHEEYGSSSSQGLFFASCELKQI